MVLLKNKVVIITGGANGMGASHVRRCAAEGAQVVFGDIEVEPGRALAAELGDTVRFVEHNVCDESGWATLVSTAGDVFGGVDALVNNAAIHWNRPVAEEDAASMRKLFEVNVIGPTLGLQAVLPAMRQRGGGSVINISSLAGIRGIPGYTAYGGSKWALRGLTQIWARELGPDNIRVNSIMPGAIDETGMFQEGVDPEVDKQVIAAIPLGRTGKPVEVSNVVVFLVSDYSAYLTGTEQVLDGGHRT